jgi:hypothetical protein
MSGYTVKVRGAVGSKKLREYACEEHGRFEELVGEPAPAEQPCPECGASSSSADTSPAVHTKFVVSVSRGKSDPKPHRLAMDLRNLGEGQPHHEWKDERAKLWEGERQKELKELLK